MMTDESGIEINVNKIVSLNGLDSSSIRQAWIATNEFLIELPTYFSMTSNNFYTILNQRNLSGLVGEIFKHAISNSVPDLVSNPHPDGRPDLLDLRSDAAISHFNDQCFDATNLAPIREQLAPFSFGGIEVKATIGSIKGASNYPVGRSRAEAVVDLNYWAHHRHACNLLGVYYDYCPESNGAPQVKSLFLAAVRNTDWYAVSTGKPGNKKTSNTSLNGSGRQAIKGGLFAHSNEVIYLDMLRRVGVDL